MHANISRPVIFCAMTVASSSGRDFVTNPPRRCLSSCTARRPRAWVKAHGATRDSLEQVKERFLETVSRLASRGSTESAVDRGAVEECILELESHSGDNVDFSLLYGPSGSQAWDVVYTTARDVRGLMQERPVPWGEATLVGQEFQASGLVTNFIRLTAVDFNILSGTSLNVKVLAQWRVSGMKSIGLRFLQASVGEIEVGDDSPLAALLTNAILPRGQWNIDVINGLRELKLLEWNFVSDSDKSAEVRIAPALSLGFLDDDLLVGRAIETGGLYVYRRRKS